MRYMEDGEFRIAADEDVVCVIRHTGRANMGVDGGSRHINVEMGNMGISIAHVTLPLCMGVEWFANVEEEEAGE
jgi:hypothetical protein